MGNFNIRLTTSLGCLWMAVFEEIDHTVFPRKFFMIWVRRLFEGGIYLKGRLFF